MSGVAAAAGGLATAAAARTAGTLLKVAASGVRGAAGLLKAGGVHVAIGLYRCTLESQDAAALRFLDEVLPLNAGAFTQNQPSRVTTAVKSALQDLDRILHTAEVRAGDAEVVRREVVESWLSALLDLEAEGKAPLSAEARRRIIDACGNGHLALSEVVKRALGRVFETLDVELKRKLLTAICSAETPHEGRFEGELEPYVDAARAAHFNEAAVAAACDNVRRRAESVARAESEGRGDRPHRGVPVHARVRGDGATPLGLGAGN